MKYDFLIDSYDTERINVVSVWSEFRDEDLPVRPKHDDVRGRSDDLLRRSSLQDLGDDAPADAHIASPRAADGHAPDARTRRSQ